MNPVTRLHEPEGTPYRLPEPQQFRCSPSADTPRDDQLDRRESATYARKAAKSLRGAEDRRRDGKWYEGERRGLRGDGDAARLGPLALRQRHLEHAVHKARQI